MEIHANTLSTHLHKYTHTLTQTDTFVWIFIVNFYAFCKLLICIVNRKLKSDAITENAECKNVRRKRCHGKSIKYELQWQLLTEWMWHIVTKIDGTYTKNIFIQK